MATELETLVVTLEGENSQLEATLRQSVSQTETAEKKIEGSASALENDFSTALADAVEHEREAEAVTDELADSVDELDDSAKNAGGGLGSLGLRLTGLVTAGAAAISAALKVRKGLQDLADQSEEIGERISGALRPDTQELEGAFQTGLAASGPQSTAEKIKAAEEAIAKAKDQQGSLADEADREQQSRLQTSTTLQRSLQDLNKTQAAVEDVSQFVGITGVKWSSAVNAAKSMTGIGETVGQAAEKAAQEVERLEEAYRKSVEESGRLSEEADKQKRIIEESRQALEELRQAQLDEQIAAEQENVRGIGADFIDNNFLKPIRDAGIADELEQQFLAATDPIQAAANEINDEFDRIQETIDGLSVSDEVKDQLRGQAEAAREARLEGLGEDRETTVRQQDIGSVAGSEQALNRIIRAGMGGDQKQIASNTKQTADNTKQTAEGVNQIKNNQPPVENLPA